MVLSLKSIRVQSGMTLEQLARDTGLTRSYLSKVERGLSNPSIASALTISKALGISVERLFGQEANHEVIDIVRAVDGGSADPSSYLSLVAGLNPGRNLKAFVMRPGRKPNTRNTIMSQHEGEEILFVLQGQIELKLGKRTELLQTGDCAHFDSTIPHKLTTMSSGPSSVLIVISQVSDRST